MPSSRCFVSMSAAARQSSSVDSLGSTPIPNSVRFGMSSVSPNMPTFPSNAGSNRSITLVISRPVSSGS